MVTDGQHYDTGSVCTGLGSEEVYIKIVNNKLMGLYEEVKKWRTSSLFEKLILCCVRCLWEQPPVLKDYGRLTWYWKNITTEEALRVVKIDVLDWLKRAAAHKPACQVETTQRAAVVSRFNTVYTCVNSWLDAVDATGARGAGVQALLHEMRMLL